MIQGCVRPFSDSLGDPGARALWSMYHLRDGERVQIDSQLPTAADSVV